MMALLINAYKSYKWIRNIMKWHKWRNFPNAIFQLHIVDIEGCSNQLLVLRQSIRWHKQYEIYMLEIIKEIQQAPQLMCYSNIIRWHPNTTVRTVKDLLVTWAPKFNQLPYGLTWPWPILALLKTLCWSSNWWWRRGDNFFLAPEAIAPIGSGTPLSKRHAVVIPPINHLRTSHPCDCGIVWHS